MCQELNLQFLEEVPNLKFDAFSDRDLNIDRVLNDFALVT